jgi:amidophosphoribosyltransferase
MAHRVRTPLPTWRDDDRLRDECGIFAISGADRAAELTFLGLYSLQHRGQESAGIVAIDAEGTASSHKDMGHVSEAFDDSILAGLSGDLALGHVRYSTAGSSNLRNAQPVLVNYRHGSMALAHNGTLTNAGELKARLTDEGAIFQTESDSEVVIHLIARSRRDLPDQQVDDALSQLVGAFSFVLTVGRTLYVARDARGFRPLVLGRLGDAVVVASETCALDIIGAEYESSRARTRAFGAAAWTAPGGRSAASWPASTRRTPIACSPCRIPPTRQPSVSAKNRVSRSSWP